MPEPEKAPAAAPPEVSPPEPSKRSKTTIIIFAVALMVAMTGVGIFVKLRHATPAERAKALQAAPKKKKEEVKAVLHMESFVVNLGGPAEKAYLRVGVDLALSGANKEQNAEVGLETALVRDTLLTTLALAKPDDLLTVEGKTKLKADLLRALQQRSPDLGVEEVYFNEFLVQR